MGIQCAQGLMVLAVMAAMASAQFVPRGSSTSPQAAQSQASGHQAQEETIVWRPPNVDTSPQAAPALLPNAATQATAMPAHAAPTQQSSVLAPDATAQAQQPTTASAVTQATANLPLATAQAAASITRVSAGSGTLPREHGQVWREYDITPYTARVDSTAKPEQAIIDWIIRDTGTEVWFSEPVGLLSASGNTLRVYHTPEMHEVVKGIVDRFVGSQAQAYEFGVRMVTVENPNWRAKAHRSMTPVGVQTPGIQAWIMAKEDAAVLLSDLKQRNDYREHNSASLLIHNGQVGSLAQLRPKNYNKNVLLRGDVWPGYQMEVGQVEEGYSLSLSPLVSLDGTIVDAVIKAQVDQVEKLVPLEIAVPTAIDPKQEVEIQVPQMVSWRVHERFRWPAEQVLVLSCGVVAQPSGGRPTVTGMNLPNPFKRGPARADAIMFLEARGKPTPTATVNRGTNGAAVTPAIRTGQVNTYNGRY